MGAVGLELLPLAVLQGILTRLDVPSICSAAASCRILHFSASQVIPHLESFHLVEIAPSCARLRHLLSCNLVLRSLKLDCTYLDDEAIECIARPQLQELCLKNCDCFSGNLLVEIGRHCSELRSLSLELGWQEDSWAVSKYSAGLEQLLEGCSILESLSLKCEGPCFDSQAYAAIPLLVAPSLKVLDLGYVAERDAKHLFKLRINQNNSGSTFSCQNLQKLSLALDRITDSFVKIMCENMPIISDLELQDEPSEEPLPAFDLTNSGIQQVGACSSLRKLALVRSRYWYPASFKRVNDLGILLLSERCTNLESIRLGGFCRITDAACRAILHSCLNLHTFELYQSKLTDLAFLDIPATRLTLVSVSLASCSLISDYSLKYLSFCRRLEVLNLKGCKSIGDDGLKAISHLCKLRKLFLNGSEVSDVGLAALGKGNIPLVVLSLRGCHNISDTGVVALVEGPIAGTLEDVDLSCIPLLTDKAVQALVQSGMQIIELRLRGCPNIGDTSVMDLAYTNLKGWSRSTLRLLDLWDCRGVSLLSAGWFKKPYFPRLRWLGLGWNSMDQSVLDSLTKERPSMRIFWDGTELDCCASWESDLHYKSWNKGEDELERWLGNGS